MEIDQIKGTILNKWKNELHHKVPNSNTQMIEGLAVHLPSLIDQLVLNPASEHISELVKINTRDRLSHGPYPLENIIIEYEVLKDVILETLEKEGASQLIENKDSLSQAILASMLSAAVEYSKVQKADFAKLEATLNHLPVGVVILEKFTYHVLFVNTAGHKLSGGYYPLHPGDHERADCFATDARGRRLKVSELPMYRASFGETLKAYEITWHSPHNHLTVVMHSDLLPSIEGESEKVLIVFQEIQERKHREEFMKEEIQLRERFVASLHHDLKTPLSVARKNMEIIKDSSLEPEVKKRAHKAIRQIDTVDRMIKDLLDTSSYKSLIPGEL